MENSMMALGAGMLFAISSAGFAVEPLDNATVEYNTTPNGKKSVPYCEQGCDIDEDCFSNNGCNIHENCSQPASNNAPVHKWKCINAKGFCIGKCVPVKAGSDS